MAIVVKRPKLSIFEKMYLPGIVKGLWITLSHAIKMVLGRSKKVTMQYPEEKWDDELPDYYRGAPALVKDEQDRERCVSCQLCEFICPPRAITIIAGEIEKGDKWEKVEKRPKTFEIDMIRCIYCGMCEEVCPEQAIYLRKDYAITGLTREDMVHDKEKLYEIGGVREGLVNKWNELK
ncbi:MAG: NADH-quinone oxidoreductase subunit I [Verrucomicrobiales bacterium]|jgi:NADH-quinone oxidoreductase subunit I